MLKSKTQPDNADNKSQKGEVKFEARQSSRFTDDKDGSGNDDKTTRYPAGASLDGTGTICSSWAPRYPTSDASMNSSMPSSYPNRRADQTTNTRSRSSTKKNTKQTPKEHPSLSERVGNSAISSTIGILKLFGDVTLSTTGAVLSPSIAVTRQVLLPQIFAALADHISNISPQRLKDWFRIVSASVYHLIAVIVSTDRGSVFRHKIVRVGADIIDVASTDTSRQAIMDGMACFVKLSEALNTPEFKSFLDQLGIWGCRMIDTAAQDKNKKLIHDFYDLIWSAIELSNDPATVVAIAEVAAYLCHALEMEDAAIHAIGRERQELQRKASAKRQEREQYQKATYQDCYLFSDPNATVEEVILSALGVLQKTVEEVNLNAGKVDTNDIPGSVVLSSEDDETASSGKVSRTVSSQQKGAKSSYVNTEEDSEPGNESEEQQIRQKVCEIDHHDIDTDFLREKILQRGVSAGKEKIERGKSLSTPTVQKSRSNVLIEEADDGKKDVEELASKWQGQVSAPDSNSRLQFERTVASSHADENNSDASSGDHGETEPIGVRLDDILPLDGETSVAHFHRILDEMLTKRRNEALSSVVPHTESVLDAPDSGHHDQGSLRERLQRLRESIGRDKELLPPREAVPLHHANLDGVERFLRGNKRVVCAFTIVALYVGTIFFAFGCYGIYVFAFQPVTKLSYTTVDPARTKSGSEMHLPLLIRENSRNPQKNEYVIRVIREVVHVNDKGQTLKVEQHDEL